MIFFNLLYNFFYFFIFIGDGVKIIFFWVFLLLKLILKIFLYFVKKILLFTKKFFKRLKIIKNHLCSLLTIRIKYFLFGSILTLLIIFIYQGLLFIKNLPSPKNIGKVNFPLSTHIYDRKGRILYAIYRDQNRTPIKLSQLPKYVIEATIAIEDKDFYNHHGVSLFGGIIRAVKETLLKKKLQGGSTITQQLVKSALLTPEKTITRKIKEVLLALWTERIYSKDQILEMYLNQVPYGGSTYGIEEAAKRYFGKPASQLTLSEAATLAGLPQAPSSYSPYFNLNATINRRNEVLEAMYKNGFISKEELIKAKNEKINIIPSKIGIKAPHFVFYLKDYLEKVYGTNVVEEGGLRVVSSLDLNIQQEIEKILREEIEKIKYLNVSNGAVLVIRPKTGEILSMVGSVDYFAKPFGAYNVVTALRQPGSAIKPIMYSLALKKGYTAATIVDDSPTAFRISNTEIYQPVNYDNRFHGKIPLRYALANSYNVPAVKVLSTIGVDNFVEWGRKMGITSWIDPSFYGLSLTLGGGEIRMIDLAQAYSILANLGYRVPIKGVLEIKDYFGNINYTYEYQSEKILDEGIAYIISDILSDNFARQWAFGSHSFLEIPGYKVAVKTGTTDNKKDNWTIGYTPEFLVAVWVGNNDGTPMNPYLTSGITGAAPIWNRVMTYLLRNYGTGAWYEKPENVVVKKCYFGRDEFFLVDNQEAGGCYFSLTPSPTNQ